MRRFTLLCIAFMFGETLFAQEKRCALHLSVGLTKTRMEHMRIGDDNSSSNGYYSVSRGTITNKYDFMLGAAITLQGERRWFFQSGLFISGANAEGPKSISYNGISNTDESWKTESLKYHVYMIELPAKIGFKVSRKYPLQFSFGIVGGAAFVNDTEWKYRHYFNRDSLDSFGNYYAIPDSTDYDVKIRGKGAIAGTAEIGIPIVKGRDNWISINIGITSYATSVTTAAYNNVEHVDLMRIRHNTYYVKIVFPLNFSYQSEKLPEGDPYPPSDYH